MPSNLTVKNQNEGFLYFTFRDLGIIGQLDIDDDGLDAEDYEDLTTAMTDENQAALTDGTYGDNLYLKIDAKAQSDKPVVVVVTGKDQLDANASEEVTIPARVQVGQCILVPEPTSGEKWKSITSVLVKAVQPANHAITAGIRFKLILFPQKADFTTDGKGGLINFDNGFGWNLGSTSRPIPNKFNPVDHYKRQRGENTLKVSQFFTVFGRALEYLRDRDFTLKVDIHEDGSANIVETRYFSLVRLNVPVSAGGDGADITQDADGHFREMFVV